jgi:hypothetical protein
VVRIYHTNHRPLAMGSVFPRDRDTVIQKDQHCYLGFYWHRSADVDPMDSLRYTFRLKGETLDTAISGLKDTTLVYDLGSHSPSSISYYSWAVSVTDGMIVVPSPDTFALWVAGDEFVNPALNRIPTVYRLGHNHPNPVSGYTVIDYDLPEACRVNLSIYNVLGQKARVLVDAGMPAGFHHFTWKPDRLANGVYLMVLKTNSSTRAYTARKKLLLLK